MFWDSSKIGPGNDLQLKYYNFHEKLPGHKSL